MFGELGGTQFLTKRGDTPVSHRFGCCSHSFKAFYNFGFEGIRAQGMPFQEAFHSSGKGIPQFALPDLQFRFTELSVRESEDSINYVLSMLSAKSLHTESPQNPQVTGPVSLTMGSYDSRLQDLNFTLKSISIVGFTLSG